ncbi:imidazole glycerol phosphate synthase subunit HisH [Pseudogemmobacter bohemicus]|uniref:imidazole glycerol phosphate synthase subunit HisH n=1 Tax=Pseudogemmobacter bohemicus TaxID=2250708 RepID=UPI000DD3AAED|nr:imidazole glycerol phosphate synthase subunit HisH [Pseudogemmobacter bohemicus]
MSLTVLVDYDSGNLHSAAKAFQRMADETGAGEVIVSARPEDVARASRIVLPGDGAFPACRRALADREGLCDAIEEAVIRKARPFFGICIGMQMLASRGLEHGDTPGFGWIPGEVDRISPADPVLKVPHMGWNDLQIGCSHPVLSGVKSGDHAYFVHSYHFRTASAETRIAWVDYSGEVTAIVGRDTIFGTQFHPEKSAATGLRIIANFLSWKP